MLIRVNELAASSGHPLSVKVKGPSLAPVGTSRINVVAFTKVTLAATPPKSAVVEEVKPVPVTVISVSSGPVVGAKLVIV